MSACFLAYITVAPSTLDIGAGKAAFAQIKEEIDKLLIEHGKKPDEEQADFLDEIVDKLCKHAWGNIEEVNIQDTSDIQSILADVSWALDSVEKCWPPDEADLTWRCAPDHDKNPDKPIILAAGETSWGDEPSGDGYRLLKYLSYFESVADALRLQ